MIPLPRIFAARSGGGTARSETQVLARRGGQSIKLIEKEIHPVVVLMILDLVLHLLLHIFDFCYSYNHLTTYVSSP